jgi:hypothetical protein
LWECIEDSRNHTGNAPDKRNERMKEIFIGTRPTHDRLVGLLEDRSRRRENFGSPRVHPLVGLVYCASCGGKMTTSIAPRQGRGYGCRKDENPVCPARVRIAAEPLEAYVEGYVIDQVAKRNRLGVWSMT